MIVLSGRMDKPSRIPAGSVNTPEHQDPGPRTGRGFHHAAEEPPRRAAAQRQGAQDAGCDRAKCGGMSHWAAAAARIGQPPAIAQPLDALKAQLEGHAVIHYAQGCDDSGDATRNSRKLLSWPGAATRRWCSPASRKTSKRKGATGPT